MGKHWALLAVGMLVALTSEKALGAEIPAHCDTRPVSGLTGVHCWEAYIDSSRGPHFTLNLLHQTTHSELQVKQSVSFYSHYETGSVEAISFSGSKIDAFLVVVDGARGSGIAHQIWSVVGFEEGRCVPLWVDTERMSESSPQGMRDLTVKRRIVTKGKQKGIELTYHLVFTPDEGKPSERIWHDTLTWDAQRHRLHLTESSGASSFIRDNMRAYRQKISTLSCNDLEDIGNGAFGLAGIFMSPEDRQIIERER